MTVSVTKGGAALESLSCLYRLIPSDFRPRFFRLVATSFVVAILELIGVASVLPLIALMVDPGALGRSQLLGPVLRGFGQASLPPVHVVGLFVIVLFVVTNTMTFLLQWWSTRFSASLAVALSERLALSHFRQPFKFFLRHPAAELAHNACTEVSQIASGGVLQLCYVVVRAVTLIVVLALLIVLSPQFSLAFFALIAILYVLAYRFSATRMAQLGARATAAAGRAVSAATEMYGACREILLQDAARAFVAPIAAAQREAQFADSWGRVLPTLPKYAIEVAAVCAIFAVPLYRSYMGQDVRAELPILATFAYAAFRLLPVAQHFYAALTTLKFYVPLAQQISAALQVPQPVPAAPRLARMPEAIRFEAVGWTYPGTPEPAVIDVSFEIRRGERVAIVGESGAGKSTIVDLLLGLLEPTAGTLGAAGAPPGPGLLWQPGTAGYVPQAPLLISDTVARNIAFVAAGGAIDMARCRDAARKAHVIAAIERLPAGFDTPIGGGGISFSGGERQRLAIARAYYGRPDLLVLDEPGSALDPSISRKVFEALCARDRDDTLVVVTHDLEHLTLFDRVVFIRHGRVVMAATYDELVARSPEFRAFQGEIRARKTREQ
jgi:ABC-type multidrug transport system fused ATPase/permease subunit